MTISHRQLLAFVQLAQSTTFAEAAEKMHLSQPALSLSIKKMEEQLGGRLLSRTTRNVRLSQEGKEFLPVALRLLNDWDNAVDDVRNLFAMNRGKLTVASMPSFAGSVLPEIIKTFHQRWPNINLSVLDVVMEATMQQVLQGRAEIGFTFEHEQMEGLEFYPLFEDKFVALVPPTNELSQLKQVDLNQLSAFPFVAMNRGSSFRRWVDEVQDLEKCRFNIAAEAGQLATVGQLVRQGLGVSIVPGICEAQMQLNRLVCVPLNDGILSRKVGIIKSKRDSLSVPANAMWEMVTQTQFNK